MKNTLAFMILIQIVRNIISNHYFLKTLIKHHPLPENIKKLVGLDNKTISIIAHRGMRGLYPEHSIIGFLRAFDADCDFLEIDINMTKDGILIITHDEYLDNFTDVNEHPEFENRRSSHKIAEAFYKDKIFIKDLTYKEIKTLTLKQAISSRSHKYDGIFRILSFEEFLEFFIKRNGNKIKKIGVYIEPKSSFFYKENKMGLNEEIEKILVKYGLNNYNESSYLNMPVVLQTFTDEDIIYYNNAIERNIFLPLVILNKWERFNLFSEKSILVHGISVDNRYFLYDRVDDLLAFNGTIYKNKEEFVENVVSKPPKKDITKNHKKMVNEKTNFVVSYLQKFGLSIGTYTMYDDIHLFSTNPNEEYLVLSNLGIMNFFTDYCITAIDALR